MSKTPSPGSKKSAKPKTDKPKTKAKQSPLPPMGERAESPIADVSAPQTDADLTKALMDSFPASDPVNYAGSITGIPADVDRTPVGTHPLGGAEAGSEEALDESAPSLADTGCKGEAALDDPANRKARGAGASKGDKSR